MKPQISTDELNVVLSALKMCGERIEHSSNVLQKLLTKPIDIYSAIVLHSIMQSPISYDALARWANFQGFKYPNGTPKGRNFKVADIQELLENPTGVWSKELIELCKECRHRMETKPGSGELR